MPDQSAPRLRLVPSRRFAHWLAGSGASLAFTTYQAGKLFFLGTGPDGQLSVFERTFARAMGLAHSGDTLWLGSLYQLWRFGNFLEPGQDQDGHDGVFVPLEGRTTGDVDIHDIGLDAEGEPVFVVTRFNCLARLDRHYSFRPVWTPPFIDRLAAEDRCHLNGLAMREGQPAFASAVARSNLAEAWREQRQGGGIVMDVESGEIACSGLSMPHSPRWYRGTLWLLNAGTGEFGHVDLASGRFEPVAFCRGFLRGLAMIGDHAVVGTSLPRDNHVFDGLPLQARLDREGAAPVCGLSVINLKTGDIEHQLQIEGIVDELYDVAALKGFRRPMALGFRTDEIHNCLKLPAIS